MKLTNYFIKKKVQSLASKAANRKHESCSLENAATILVLYQAEDQEAVMDCLASLRKQQKQVLTCVYAATGILSESPAAASMTVQADKDLNPCFIPQDAVVEQFKALKADMLIDLTHPDCYPMQYLLLQHPCGYKVGVKHLNADLYDLSFSVADSEGFKQKIEHILFYLQTIRSK